MVAQQPGGLGTSSSTHFPRAFMGAPFRARLALALCCAAGGSLARADVGYELPLFAGPAQPLIISSDVDPAVGFYTIINLNTGADRFYANGYFGRNVTLANVEAGHVWNGHETMGSVSGYVSNSPVNATANQYDYHATAVGFVMVGQGEFPYYYYQLGMAPEAALASVSIATDWIGNTGAFDINSSTFVYGYKTVMQSPVSVTHKLLFGISITSDQHVDVVNSSWGFDDPAATSQARQIIDNLTFLYHQTVCISSGNHETGTALVGGPAGAFNVIAVGALGTDQTDPKYNAVADFSNTGPNDFYNPVTKITTHGVRAAVSICAPGTDLILPAYTGATGTNADGTLIDTSEFTPDLLDKLYFVGVAGTSFSSPTVAGGAALVVDAGYVNFNGGVAIDGRVIKAVLLNSARKLPGWTNNTVNVGGVLTTAQGLDFNSGAGALDLNRAYDQYLSGTTNNVGADGVVHPLGWTFGHVTAATSRDYIIDTPLHQGDTLTATLDWFIPTFFNSDASTDATDDFLPSDLHDLYFDQLGLQVWLMENGQFTTLIADSHSPYNNVDHLYFNLPQDGTYALRVSFLGTTYDVDGNSPLADDYGLAWSISPVPEPGSLLLLGLPLLLLRRRSASAENRS